jgi:hypothetical protein
MLWKKNSMMYILTSEPKDSDRILIKIDMEGMETEMLDGAAGFLRKFKNLTLIIEEKLSGEDNIRKLLNIFG